MKNKIMLFMSILLVCFMAGCGKTDEFKEQTLTCRQTQEEEGLTIEQVISMTYKGDELSRMKVEVISQLTDKTVQDNWDKFVETMDQSNEEFDDDGISLKVTKDAKNFKYSVATDIDVINATEEALERHDFGGIKDDNSTIEENKKEAEDDGATCEIK